MAPARKSKKIKKSRKVKSKKTYRGRPDMPQDYYLIINQYTKYIHDDRKFAIIAIHERFPLISPKQIEEDIKTIIKDIKDLDPIIKKINYSISRQSYAKDNNTKYVPTP
jgi:hypothetical protein